MLLGLLLAVALLLSEAQGDAEEAAKRRFNERARLSAALTQSVFSALGASSGEQLAERYGGAPREVERALESQRARSRPQSRGYLAVVDAQGRVLATAGRVPSRLAPADAVAGRPTLSDVVRVGGQPFVEYAIGFPGPGGPRVLVSGIPLRLLTVFLNDYLARLHEVDNAGIAVVDSRGVTLTRQGELSPPDATAPGRLAATASVPGTPWTLRLEADRGVVLAAVNKGRSLSWILLGALALATLVGFWLYMRMVASVRRHREATEAVAEGRQQLANLVDALDEAVVLHHADGVTELLNASAQELAGVEADALHGAVPDLHLVDCDGEPLADEDTPVMRALNSGSACRQVIGLEGPDGSRRWLQVRARPLVRPGEQSPHAVVATCTDVTEQHDTERHLADLAQRDPLTGLWNRRRFEGDVAAQLARCRRYGERAALLLLDLDNFKQINDTLGHLAGDEVLRALADGLSQRLRASDSAARIGGDEFAVLLLNVDEARAREMAGEVATRLKHFARELDVRGDVSISVGVALLSAETGGVSEAFAVADHAMYEDKRRSGRSLALEAGPGDGVTIEGHAGSAARDASLRALLAAVQARDSQTAVHSREVVRLARAVARSLGLDDDQVSDVESAALLHDLGKIAVPDAILRKKGPLTDVEALLMRQHPVVGAHIVSSVPDLEHLAPAIRAEHERWDGTGYPDGLAGRAIPLASRITFVCDAYHAMTTDRPYRRALSMDAALAEIATNAGRQFCPDSARELLEIVRAEAVDEPLMRVAG